MAKEHKVYDYKDVLHPFHDEGKLEPVEKEPYSFFEALFQALVNGLRGISQK